MSREKDGRSLPARVLAALAPRWTLSRMVALDACRQYEAVRPTRTRTPVKRSRGDGDTALAPALASLREQARNMDENHDVAHGALDVLVDHVVGRGVVPAAQIKDAQGKPAAEANAKLDRLFREWARRPDVTGELQWGKAQRLMARSWFRDGEAFCMFVEGNVPGFSHGTKAPLSLELLEADVVPHDYDAPAEGTFQGIQKDGWGRPKAYYVYKTHPGAYNGNASLLSDLKRVEAGRMAHLKMTTRIGQTRGCSVFAAVILRLGDVKDYEDSERVAARLAAMMCVSFKRDPNLPLGSYEKNPGTGRREIDFERGMVIDDLKPGESVDTFMSNRPNSGMEAFRSGQLRAVAAGTGAGYSSLSKNYNGTYSSQRQELVEQYGHYETLRDEFVGAFVERVWRRFVDMALLAGLVRLPRDADPLTLYDAEFRGQARPWIDPKKEIEAELMAVQAGFKSRQQVIRERGSDPDDVTHQIERDVEGQAAKGLTFSSNYAHAAKAAPAPKEEKDDEDGKNN
jgi:lambda family phage portal protein